MTQPPENNPVTPPPDAPPPSDPPPPPPAPVNVPVAPENQSEVLDAVKALTETVAKLVNNQEGLPGDVNPTRPPWHKRGGRVR